MILRCSGYEFRLPGVISCPGQVPNRPGMEFQANSDFHEKCHPNSTSPPTQLPQKMVPRPPHQDRTLRLCKVLAGKLVRCQLNFQILRTAYFYDPRDRICPFFFRRQLAAHRSRITL